MISLRAETPRQSTTFFPHIIMKSITDEDTFTTESPSTSLTLLVPQFYSICCSCTAELEVVVLAV